MNQQELLEAVRQAPGITQVELRKQLECYGYDISNKLCESLLPEGLELLSTFPEGNGCHNANENRKGDIVVGSALRKSLSQGQPVSSKNDVKTNIDIAAIARGTIHLNPEGVEFSLPLDPRRYKLRLKNLVRREKDNRTWRLYAI